MRSTLFEQQNMEVTADSLFTKQNSKMLKADLRYGQVMARQGAMVAYQGQANFEHGGSGGLKGMIKKAVTGEGLPLMKVSGQAEVFMAQQAGDVHIIDLENDSLSINGMSILAFSNTLQWDIQMVRGAGMVAGGLFNTTLSGNGQVAIVTEGSPVVLTTADAPTFVDPDAAVCWSANLNISVQQSVTFQSLIGRGSGESAQLAFNGDGFVIVQPSETMRYGGGQQQSGEGQQRKQGFDLGQFLGG